MIRRLLDKSAGHFWWPSEFENVANPDLVNLKHLQNPGHLPLTAASIWKLAGFTILYPVFAPQVLFPNLLLFWTSLP